MRMTTLCYLEQNGCYLMLHRTKKENDFNKDKWLGIGGKFEEAESPEDCMRREVFEETGLTPTAWSYRGIITFISDEAPCEYMHLFTVTAWEGTEKECDEGELAWIRKDDLLKLPMWEGDRLFLERIACPSPFFSMKLQYRGETLEKAFLNGRPLSGKE